MSSLIVQMKTEKIGLQKFLYQYEVSNVGDVRCEGRRREETMKYVLNECPQFKEMKKTIWSRKVRKAKLN